MEVVQFSPEVVLCDPRAADIVAENDWNVILQCCLCAGDDAFEYDIAVILLDFAGICDGTVKQCVGKSRREGGAEEGVVLFEQTDDFLVRFCTVFDGIHAVFQCNANALWRFYMSGNLISGSVSLLTDGANHFRRHLQFTGNAFFFCVQHTAGDHQLHEIYMFGFGLFQMCQSFLYGMGSNGDRPSHVTAGNGDALIRCKNTGTWLCSGFDLISQAGIKVSKATHGADRGDTAEYFIFCEATDHFVSDSAGQSVAHDGLHFLFIVLLFLLRLAISGKVNMHIDQTGHYIMTAQIDHMIAGQIGAIRYDIYDLFVINQNDKSFLNLHFFCSVEYFSIG